MFADDTTLYESNADLNELISSFKNKLGPLIEWCKYNKLDINWSKTFFMFVTNKHIKNKLPKEIKINDTSVKVVDSFKLLGVTIDNGLNFTKYTSDIRITINRKLFSIKRLFYLSTSVKIQFFKTFILPYFDYCLSLLIYFPKYTIQKLSNCFNNCIFMLLKFKIEPEEDQEISNEDIIKFNNKLQTFGLFSFQHRLMNKILTFTHKIINNQNSPSELKKDLTPEAVFASEEQTTQFTILRNNKKINKNAVIASRYNQQTFSFFFRKLILNFINCNFNLSFNLFLQKMSTETKSNFLNFLKTFDKFNISYKFYSFNAKKFKKNLKLKQKLKKINIL